ncbi:MAG: hypothetical protein RIT27_464 [Pseudomonadota bacterium]|jgi:NTP pyrophosphatase (non-canonical NTP hydrolase)
MTTDSLENLNQKIAQFAKIRDWDQFHNPKNLAMALIGEAGELVEHFQWLTFEQSMQLSPEKRQAVSYELADILIYLLRMADRLEIDILQATQDKMAINEQRYPVEKVRGDARKANEY